MQKNSRYIPPYPVQNNCLAPPPYNPPVHFPINSSFHRPPVQNQSFYKRNHHYYTPTAMPAQIFFEPIHKVPPPDFDKQDDNQDQEKQNNKQTRQQEKTQKPIDTILVKQEKLPFLGAKGIIKIKLGAVYTKKDKIPDDYQCFISLIQSIFPCLSPDFKQPLNNLLGTEEIRAQELEERLVSPVINKDEKIYKIFYINAEDKPINIKSAQEYNALNLELANNKSLVHPIYGLKMFIIPQEGDIFLHRFSLGGDREVELDEKLWKLLFTDNNYISNLRVEKPLKKKKEIDSDNLNGMREILSGNLEESLQLVDFSDDSDSGSGDEGKKEEDDKNVVKQENDDVGLKRNQLDEFSIVDQISVVTNQKQEKDEQKQVDEKVDNFGKQKENEDIELKDDEVASQASSSQSQSDDELDQDELRDLIRRKIDAECKIIFDKQFKNYEEDCKYDEMQFEMYSKLFFKREDSEIDSIPAIHFEEVYQSQLKEADIEFILNPFQNDNQQKPLEVAKQEQFEKKQQNPKEQQIEYPFPQQGIIVQPVVKQDPIPPPPPPPPPSEVKNDQKDIKIPEEKKIQKSINPPMPIIVQPFVKQNKQPQPQKIEPPIFKEQVKAPAPPPVQNHYIAEDQHKDKKKRGFFSQLKHGAANLIKAIKGDGSQEKKKFKWAPMEMAAIIRQMSPQADLLHANAERVNNEKFIALPNKVITKTVKLINLSRYKWPQNVFLDKVKGDKEIKLESPKVNNRLNPGEEGTVKIHFRTPKKKGTYKCLFSLKGNFVGQRELHFGELFGVQVEVKKQQYADYEQKLYEDAEILVQENLGSFEECLRSLRCNKFKIKKARKDLLLKFKK